MLSSAVECLLLLFTDIYFDEALKTGIAPSNRNGMMKHLLDWTLADLLRVARAANWVPGNYRRQKGRDSR
jgi:hypothetical protein